MGIIKALTSSVGGAFADQWKDIYTASEFDEYTVVAPGIMKNTNNGRGANVKGSTGVITNGSKIFVPENTAAFIFSQAGIENVITTPGGYEYWEGEDTVFNSGRIETVFKQAADRLAYGGISTSQKEIAYVNLREIRDIRFGTRGPQVYNDLYYNCDLEIYAYGSFSVKVADAESFVRHFVPPNTTYYSFADQNVRGQLLSDFLQSFTTALNSMSQVCRISELPSHANELSTVISSDQLNAGSWKDRFGFEIVKVSIENIEFSPESRDLVNQFNTNKMNMKAYEDVSQRASDIAAQQKIAEGIQDNGLGDMGGMIFGMNMAQNLGTKAENKTTQQAPQQEPQSVPQQEPQSAPQQAPQQAAQQTQQMSLDEQIEAVKKLKDLMDAGILTEDEFNAKKKEVMGL